MHCMCEDDEDLKYLRVEGDFGADAIWCDDYGSNFDIEDIPVSQSLKEKLIKWANEYGEWIDLEKDCLFENGVFMEAEHNKRGQLLTEEVRKELGVNVHVHFSASISLY